VQHDVQESSIDLNRSVVLDETELSEFVHEKIDVWRRRADHLRKRFLGNSGEHWLSPPSSKDLDNLKAGSALKVPLADLVLSKEKVRSALNRATRKANRKVATASDTTFLYVWNVSE
jgi:hypothetical protein